MHQHCRVRGPWHFVSIEMRPQGARVFRVTIRAPLHHRSGKRKENSKKKMSQISRMIKATREKGWEESLHKALLKHHGTAAIELLRSEWISNISFWFRFGSGSSTFKECSFGFRFSCSQNSGLGVLFGSGSVSVRHPDFHC